MDRRSFLGAASALTIAACAAGSKDSFRYRLKVHAYAAGERRSGESVLETQYVRTAKTALIKHRTYAARAWGEAVIIDMGGGKSLFGLLRRPGGTNLGSSFDPLGQFTLVDLLPEGQFDTARFEKGLLFDDLRRRTGELELPRRHWPSFITFDDVADVSTACAVLMPDVPGSVSPLVAKRSLAEAFGSDARLDRITVEFVVDAVSNRIRKVLPWIERIQGAQGAGWTVGDNRTLADNLTYRNFRMDGDRSEP